MTFADHFLHPEAAPLLLLVPLAWLLIGAVDRARARRLDAAIGPRLDTLAPERDAAAPRTRRRLVCAGLLFALLALLEPCFGAPGARLTPRGADVVVALDVSRSMLARDVAPSRLRAAQRELAALARDGGGDRLALVLFAGAAQRCVPLTRDLESFQTLADAAGPESVATGGSNLEAALDAALAALAALATPAPPVAGETGAHADDDGAAIVLLSDGDANAGDALAAAGRCRVRHVVVHALGFGSRDGSKIALASPAQPGGEEFLRDRAGRDVVSALDATTLAAIAAATGGSYADAAALPHALVDLVRKKIEPHARATLAAAERRERSSRFQWPLAIALLLFAAASRFGDARSR